MRNGRRSGYIWSCDWQKTREVILTLALFAQLLKCSIQYCVF